MKKTPLIALNFLILSSLFNVACARNAEEVPAEEVTRDMDAPAMPTEEEQGGADQESSLYEDGTYVGVGEYQSPAGAETLAVTFVVKNDKVESLSVYPESENEVSHKFQVLFSEGVVNLVSGKDLGEIKDLGAVNGSSLTPKGFNAALADIKSQAKI